jgi:ParB/RepB/Spo0J family partition protein
VGRYPPFWIIHPPLTIKIRPARSRACKGASRRWDILYKLWHGFGAVFSASQGFRLRTPRLFARGLRGRKLSGFSVQFGWRQARGPPLSGSKAPQVQRGQSTILLPEEPLTEINRWAPRPGNSPQKGQAMITIAPRTGTAKKSALVALDQIDFPTNARPTHADKVSELVSSIRMIGLQTLPTVVERNGRYMLVAGRHRVEALRVIGKDPVPVRIVDFDDRDARLWAISENLHRNELTALERAEQVTEFARLSKEKADASMDEPLTAKSQGEQIATAPSKVPRQLGSKPQGGRPEGGNRAAARDLGLTEQEVRRSRTIAALSDMAKAKAVDLGLDRNQSALLDAAKAKTMVTQISALEQRAVAPLAPRPSPLRNLENLEAGNFARWVKETTPNDRLRVIDMLERAAAILRDEMQAERAA